MVSHTYHCGIQALSDSTLHALGSGAVLGHLAACLGADFERKATTIYTS